MHVVLDRASGLGERVAGEPAGAALVVAGATAGVATAILTTSITQLLGGTHTITAVYDGLDPLFSGSTSANFTQTVLQHSTTTTITNAVANPSTFGSSITFTATVTPRIGGVQPTGTVNFYDGVVTPAKLLGTSGALTVEQHRARELLRAVLGAGGFRGIQNEWWHFEMLDREHLRRHFARVD